jgi:hypothetical protein
LLILSRSYPSALTFPGSLEALLPLPEAVAVDAVAVVLWASAVLLAEALAAVHLHSLLAVAGKSTVFLLKLNQH